MNENSALQVSSVNDTDDREAHKKHWFVVETRMNHEKKVRDQLMQIGIECFLPAQIVERQWKYRKKKIEQLLIPMKVFVNITKQDKLKVLRITSVSRFMHERGASTSVIIPNYQMSQFQLMLNSASEPVCVCSTLEPGIRVRVVNGPLVGLDGSFISQEGRSKIKIEMNVLGSVCVEIPLDDVEFLNEMDSNNN